MNLIKAWKAHKKYTLLNEIAKEHLAMAKEIMSDDSKTEEWKKYMMVSSACLLGETKYQEEFRKAIGLRD